MSSDLKTKEEEITLLVRALKRDHREDFYKLKKLIDAKEKEN